MIIVGEITEDTVAQVLVQGVRQQPYLICSGGGDTSAACALYDFLCSFESTTIAMGHVASAAVPIFAAGTVRFAFPSTTFLWHEPYVEGAQEGRSDDLSVLARTLQDWYSWGCGALEDRIGSDLSFDGRGAGCTFDAAEAVELGLVHEVLGADKSLTELVRLSLNAVPKKPAKKKAKKK